MSFRRAALVGSSAVALMLMPGCAAGELKPDQSDPAIEGPLGTCALENQTLIVLGSVLLDPHEQQQVLTGEVPTDVEELAASVAQVPDLSRAVVHPNSVFNLTPAMNQADALVRDTLGMPPSFDGLSDFTIDPGLATDVIRVDIAELGPCAAPGTTATV